jgi:hypothetical protein
MVLILMGLVVMMACLGIQAVTVGLVIHHYNKAAKRPYTGRPYVEAYKEIGYVMVLLLFSIMFQMAGWALLFQLLRQFEDFETALYFSGITFTSLGYGDITLPRRVRILSAMEAADGLLMFGIISAVFMSAMQNSLQRLRGSLAKPAAQD